MITSQTFPGVYASVVDDSFTVAPTSRFRAGLIGVAEKGPFNTPTRIRSVRDYARVFGRSISNRYMANAAAILSDLSDGTVVVRVGRQYETVATNGGSGFAGAYTLYTSKANLFNAGDYIRVSQPGKPTTVNARIDEVGDGSLTLVSVTDEAQALAANYTAASIDSCSIADAANEAEAFLYGYDYDDHLELAGEVVGDKNSYEFTVDGDQTLLSVGDLIKIEQDDRATTREVRIKEVKNALDGVARVLLETSDNTEYGYQALPLQDSYTAGKIYKVAETAGVRDTALAVPMFASSAGTWANSDGERTGLIVKVAPGSKPDTKKILVYWDSALVETIDNLTTDADSDDYYITRINGNSSYITIHEDYTVTDHPANTVNPWNSDAITAVNIAAFDKGANGATPTISDFVGTVNPADDSQTGLKAFDDESVEVDVLVAPDVSTLFADQDVAIAQEMARVARRIYAVGLIDVPIGLNAREATDWHNGAGLYSYRGRIDTYSLACFWNWITIVDTFNGEEIQVPPTVGALRCMAYTFDAFKPWYASAGETRGVIPEATLLQFNKLSNDTRSAMYGDGNSVNPIMYQRAGGATSRIMLYGDRTLQRAESKLTAIHSVVLTNYIVRGMSLIGRRFIFDPNDRQLLDELRVAFTSFLDSIANERGVEEYNLVVDESNNTAANRNRREVIVDLSFIPVDAVERIYINATVRESGASLNSVA